MDQLQDAHLAHSSIRRLALLAAIRFPTPIMHGLDNGLLLQ